MKVSKQVCKNGSITIPKTVRAEAGLFPGNAVDIEASTDGSVTITSSAPHCRFCGSPEQLITAENIVICNSCAEKIISKVGNIND